MIGMACRCEYCEMKIMAVKGELPAVCPFCQKSMEYTEYELPEPQPESEKAEQAFKDELQSRSGAVYSPFKLRVRVVLLILLSLTLGLTLIYKIHNVEYFYYQPLVNIYSLSVGIFILTRFILSSFYSAPPDVGYEPTVSVLVACMNEEPSIHRTIDRIYSEGYPAEKLSAICINDGSTDNTLYEMLLAQNKYHELIVVDFEKNKGKRHGMAIGALLAKSEILVYVDSDSFLLDGAVHKVVQGLNDPQVAAVSGHTDVENVAYNTLTKMQDVRYFVSYRVMKAAESIFGAVSCCPGCFSAYRRVCVLNVLDMWLHQKFLGKYATYGDDRGLTNYLLKDYKILYDDEALATTIVPTKWKQYIKQQARWKRSWVREFFFAGRFMWKKHPLAAIAWYLMTLLPFMAPIIMFNALVLQPILTGRSSIFYLSGVFVVTMLWSLYYLEKIGRPYWWSGFVFVVTYIFFFSWQGYYSALTIRYTGWGTR
ncbi:MAG: glycosyltransferase [Kiritimatiellae bacterium]|jgi:hyaluronan synthase|nr:glycosyltransferase [Kiritimatiellia bacterium]